MTGQGAPRLLVVTAVAAEQQAVTAGLTAAPEYAGGAATVVAAGVGPAAAAAATAAELASATAAGEPFALVVSAGVGGGFAPLVPVGATVVASRIVAADLGVATPDGFADVAELGFGTAEHLPPPALVRAAVEALPVAALAPVLTVSSATGTAARAAELSARHPGAGAEAMEGFGVAEAAARAGVPVMEIRTASNTVGPRDRASWRIPEALAALTAAFTALAPVIETTLTGEAGG